MCSIGSPNQLNIWNYGMIKLLGFRTAWIFTNREFCLIFLAAPSGMVSLPLDDFSTFKVNPCLIFHFHSFVNWLNLSSKIWAFISCFGSSYCPWLSEVSLASPLSYCSALLSLSFKASFSCNSSTSFWNSSLIFCCSFSILAMNSSMFTLSLYTDGSILDNEYAVLNNIN